jgi:hypothetical protein
LRASRVEAIREGIIATAFIDPVSSLRQKLSSSKQSREFEGRVALNATT